jgi:ATP-dependent protease ClpP protease subunit
MIRGVSNRKTRRHPDKARGAVSAGPPAPGSGPLGPDDLVFGTAQQLRKMAEALQRGDSRSSATARAQAAGRVTSYRQRHPDADLSTLVGRPICETPAPPREHRPLAVDASGAGAAELWIDDYLEAPNMWGEGVSARDVREALDQVGSRDVVVNMNSGGGDYFEGVAIYQALRSHPGNVYVAVVALAASAASVVTMAGDTVGIGDGAFIMVHNASSFAYGNASDLLTVANMLDAVDTQIAGFYARRGSNNAEHWRTEMAAESWYGPAAAIDNGLADELLDPPAVDPAAPTQPASEPDPLVDNVFAAAGWHRPTATAPPDPAPVPEPTPAPVDWSPLFRDDLEAMFT